MAKSFTTKIRKKARIFPFNTDFQYHTKDPSKCNKTSKGNEHMYIGKKDIKVTVFRRHDYVEYPAMERFNDKTRTKQQLQQSCMI